MTTLTRFQETLLGGLHETNDRGGVGISGLPATSGPLIGMYARLGEGITGGSLKAPVWDYPGNSVGDPPPPN